jgi:hypothetical protein
MLSRQERDALVMLAVVAAILLAAHLILSSVGKEAFAHPYGAGSEAGDLVVLEGTVETLRTTEEGGHLILTISGVNVFVPGGADGALALATGDTVTVVGTVQYYRGAIEIVVEDNRDIRTY